MIHYYFDRMPGAAKVGLFLEEAGLTYEAVPVDAVKREHDAPSFLAINLTGRLPAIVDTDGPGGGDARVFGSTAILIYLAEKTGMFLGPADDRPELLSWVLFTATGDGPFRGTARPFQFAAPVALEYAVTRNALEMARRYRVLNERLEGRRFVVGESYTIADMSAWGWLARAWRGLEDTDDQFAGFPNLKRLFETLDSRPAAARARQIGKDHPFERANDEETAGTPFPPGFPPSA